MKQFLLSIALAVASWPLAALATADKWENNATLTYTITYAAPLVIDATNVINNAGGAIQIQGDVFEPFDFSNALNFTNRGSMVSYGGWRFDTAPSESGVRHMAANFANLASGTDGVIRALDYGTYATGIGFSIDIGGKLYVSATNIINSGFMSSGALGILSLEGKKVNLAWGRMQIDPMTGSGAETEDIYYPDAGIYDEYWGMGTNNINTGNILTSVNPPGATSPRHNVTTPGGGGMNTMIGTYPGSAFVFSNGIDPVIILTTNVLGEPVENEIVTNCVIQVGFVGSPSTDVSGDFYPSSSESNLFSTITIGLYGSVTNPVTGGVDINTLFLSDRLASETNRNLVLNSRPGSPPTYRPAPYLLSRVNTYGGLPANWPLTGDLLFKRAVMSNATASAVYAAYSATLEKTAARQLAIPEGDITNVPGRIEIKADTLDLTRTRMRADGLVKIETPHLISSANAIVDAFHLTYDLGSTNGSLRVQNLAQSSVRRFGGTIACWSGTWTNVAMIPMTNFSMLETNIEVPDGQGGTNIIATNMPVFAPITNAITVGFHVLILDASQIRFDTPVITHEFITRSTNVTLMDPLTIIGKFLTEAQSFTVATNGELILADTTGTILTQPNPVQTWTVANAPNLLYLTNEGYIYVPLEARFGDDRPLPYQAFVNKRGGLVESGAITIRSVEVLNSGSLYTTGPLGIQAQSVRLEEGSSQSGGDLSIAAGELRLRNYTNYNLAATRFTITNSLSDSGPSANVLLRCDGGLSFQCANATGRPKTGDLLGTTIDTHVPMFTHPPHVWPAADRGASKAGFSNNMALGWLTISVDSYAEAYFDGATANSALYVDYLQFAGINLEDLESVMAIGPDLVIYFADSNLPAEQLDGLFGGRLRWVSDYAGANSSVPVVINGKTVLVNRALRNSKVIDSDGDGVPNYYDTTPFGGDTAALTVSAAVVPQPSPASSPALAISWLATPNVRYQVEFTTNFQAANWQPLLTYTNTASTNRQVTVWDTNAPAGAPKRLYRVGYTP